MDCEVQRSAEDPFGYIQEAPTYLLVLEHEEKLEVVILANIDVQQIEGLFRKNISSQLPMALYHIDTGLVTQGPAKISEEKLSSHEFIELLTFVKFLRGDLSYTAQEFALLKDKFADQNRSELEEFILHKLLRWKPYRLLHYKNSVLERALRP